MALRSAVAVGSEIPTGLWGWIDRDVYAYEGFQQASICHRPAWLYQRLYSKAALHGLVREVIPDDKTFWLTWLACPQLINIKILRKHFTDNSWLNLAYVYQQYAEIALMLLRPRKHFREMPGRVLGVGAMWLGRGFCNAVFSPELIKGYHQFCGYLTAVFGSLVIFSALSDWQKIAQAVANGDCSPNPLTWEPFLDNTE